ncbi:hypothetical protein FRB90_011210 [Tulasnella sp. 427]|nr:hypothetical protein FRB90_011210 [Tulasnella sp. 427]
MSDSSFGFSGNGGMAVDEFVKNVAIRANSAGKQFDNQWNVDFVVTHLSGPALKWYQDLDKDTRGDWTKLRKALQDKYYDPKPSPPKRSIWRRATGSSSRGPSRSNSLADNFENMTFPSGLDGAPPSYSDSTAANRGVGPSSSSWGARSSALVEEPGSISIDPAARRLRVVSKPSGKEMGYISRVPTESKWFVCTTNPSEAVHVKLGTDNTLEILNGPPTSQPPLVLTVGWSEDGREPSKEAERYASLSYYEKSFGGFLGAKDGWVAKWQSGASATVKPLQKKTLGFGGNATLAISTNEKTKAIRLHNDLKAYKKKDPNAIEVEFVLEPLQ